MTSDPAELLSGALDAVAAASTAILEVYASAHDVEYKADDSPITRADRAAHDILATRLALRGEFPDGHQHGDRHPDPDRRGAAQPRVPASPGKVREPGSERQRTELIEALRRP
mgnify:CR=1 FL=1